ncbi:MAG: sulfite exporter TauE/SafE family protein [Chloroflexi bacterium]|nr:sulfite exporter TauE/SafE family protein [Chloroflexota bacterium]
MRRNIIISVVIGAVAGMIAGLTGIGGGMLLVPLLAGVLLLEQHQAHGTSLAVIFPIGVAGLIAYAIQGNIDWVFVLVLATGSLVGVVLGAKLMMRMRARQLRWLFSALVVVLGILMVIGVQV